MLVENHQIVPCWYVGLSQGMYQLSMHVCSKKSSTADFKWFIYLFETELRSTGTAHHFAYLLNTTDYRILRMDEDYDRMYIGSKDHILSLDLHDINKDPHIVRSFSHSHSTPPLTPNSGPSNGLLEEGSATSAAPRAKCSVQLLQPVLKPCGMAENDFILEWMLDHYNTVIGFGQFQQDKYQLSHFAVLSQISNKCPLFYKCGTVNRKMSCFPLWQIHWPVSERRKMECLVSGKDANVSKLANSIY